MERITKVDLIRQLTFGGEVNTVEINYLRLNLYQSVHLLCQPLLQLH